MKFRNWFLTINYSMMHPPGKNELHAHIVKNFNNIKYLLFKLDSGANQTFHYHILICLKNPVHIKKIHEVFPRAHIRVAKGNIQPIINYIYKNQNDYLHTLHESGTRLKQGKRSDLEEVLSALEDGNDLTAIRKVFPKVYMKYRANIHRIHHEILNEKYADKRIPKEVTYIYGSTGSGKTRYVLDKYGDENVYRITDYKNPFDQYIGQEIIIFEEFRSSEKIEKMLNYLDLYPLHLPARYNNIIARYSKVYIISNISLLSQFKNVRDKFPETWFAFIRRIHHVHLYLKTNSDKTEVITFDSTYHNLHFQNLVNKKNFLGAKTEARICEIFDKGYDYAKTNAEIGKLSEYTNILGLIDIDTGDSNVEEKPKEELELSISFDDLISS